MLDRSMRVSNPPDDPCLHSVRPPECADHIPGGRLGELCDLLTHITKIMKSARGRLVVHPRILVLTVSIPRILELAVSNLG
jgi:hypothetical protein